MKELNLLRNQNTVFSNYTPTYAPSPQPSPHTGAFIIHGFRKSGTSWARAALRTRWFSFTGPSVGILEETSSGFVLYFSCIAGTGGNI